MKQFPKFYTTQERLEEKREIVDGHWLWTGRKNANGYGVLTINRKPQLVHREAYKVYKDTNLPNNCLVLHKPPCVLKTCFQPEHLYSGDYQDNSLDSVITNTHFEAKQTHCIRGHGFDYIDSRGKRVCKTCAYIRSYKHEQKQKDITNATE